MHHLWLERYARLKHGSLQIEQNVFQLGGANHAQLQSGRV
jgi:hypothetical protein